MSSKVEHAAVTERYVESSQIPSTHIQANAAMLVLGIEKVNVVPEFAVGRWQGVPVRQCRALSEKDPVRPRDESP